MCSSYSVVTRGISSAVILSTIYDIVSRKFEMERKEVFLVFSLVDNFKQLITINESKSVLKSVDCIKSLAGEID